MNKNNKKVVRLTESDLVRIVKRVLSEQESDAKVAAEKSYNEIEKSMNPSGWDIFSWADGTDEESIVRAILDNVTTQEIYNELLKMVQTKQKKRLVMDWLDTELQSIMNFGHNTEDLAAFGGGDSNEIYKIESRLKQFNPKENFDRTQTLVKFFGGGRKTGL
jgi:hypothetical protein